MAEIQCGQLSKPWNSACNLSKPASESFDPQSGIDLSPARTLVWCMLLNCFIHCMPCARFTVLVCQSNGIGKTSGRSCFVWNNSTPLHTLERDLSGWVKGGHNLYSRSDLESSTKVTFSTSCSVSVSALWWSRIFGPKFCMSLPSSQK